jgi:hypothetical protein
MLSHQHDTECGIGMARGRSEMVRFDDVIFSYKVLIISKVKGRLPRCFRKAVDMLGTPRSS